MADTQPQPLSPERPDGLTDREWANIQRGRSMRSAAGKPINYVRDRSRRVRSNTTTWWSNRSTNNPQQKFSWGAFATAVLGAILVVALLGGAFVGLTAAPRFASLEQQLKTQEQNTKDAIAKAEAEVSSEKDKVIATANEKAATAEKQAADKDAANKTLQEQLKAAQQMGPANPAKTVNAPSNANQDIYRKLAQQKGQVEGVDYSFNIDRNLAASVNPGIGTFGRPIYNEQELVSALGNGSDESEKAISEFQAKSGLTIPRQNVLNPNYYVCVQQLKDNQSPNMAYISGGTAKWGNTLVDRAGAVNCTYVGPEVVSALASGKSVTPSGFRGNCLNPQEMPVTTTKQPNLPRVTPPVAPPVKTIVHNPPKEKPPVVVPKDVQRCDVTTWKIVKISEEAAKDTDRYKDISASDCKPPVVVVPKDVQRCDVTTWKIVKISEEAAKDTDRYKDISASDCKPPVVTCPEGQVPNPNPASPDKCLEVKNPGKGHPAPVDHDPAPSDTPKTPAPQPLPNPIDPTTPDPAPAPPVVKAPDAEPTPNPAPVPVKEVPAPTPTTPAPPHVDPDDVKTAAPAATKPVAATPAAPVVVKEPAPAPVKKTPAPAPVATQVASTDSPATTAVAVTSSDATSVG
jgi:hypothetical protein